MGLFKPFPKPEQPIECWYLVAHNIDLGVLGDKLDYSWAGRTKLFSTTAQGMDMLRRRMPRDCSPDNSWVIALISTDGGMQAKEYSKREFLRLFVDVPLLPSDVFQKSYKAYLGDIENHISRVQAIVNAM